MKKVKLQIVSENLSHWAVDNGDDEGEVFIITSYGFPFMDVY